MAHKFTALSQVWMSA
uniref:Uncharacterized protein n=1 Tax=Anguilla anguilla TaxID=7936 RepID=A0A0E9XC27_ANGAN